MTGPQRRPVTLGEFLLARIVEDEALVQACDLIRVGEPYEDGSGLADRDGFPSYPWGIDGDEEAFMAGPGHPTRILAECAAKRRIVELHKSWPVLVQQPMKLENDESADPGRMVYRASQQMAWLTEQEHRTRFGNEPPTGPILRALASVYADHPDYREEWKP